MSDGVEANVRTIARFCIARGAPFRARFSNVCARATENLDGARF